MISTSNLRASTVTGSSRGVAKVLLGVAAIVPALSMGIAVPAAVELSSAQANHDAQVSRLNRRDNLYEQLDAYRGTELLDQLRALGGTVRDMIPCEGTALDEFGWIRARAAGMGLDLRSVQMNAGGESMADVEAKEIVLDEVQISFTGTPASAFALVADLRGSGHPLVIRGFSFSRNVPTSPTFQVELRLGFLRRPSDTTPQVSDSLR